MNLAGIVIPGDRIPAVPGRQVLYHNGTLYSEAEPDTMSERNPTVILPRPPVPTAPPPALRLF
jgi:ATP-dependent Lhr-like helicase